MRNVKPFLLDEGNLSGHQLIICNKNASLSGRDSMDNSQSHWYQAELF